MVLLGRMQTLQEHKWPSLADLCGAEGGSTSENEALEGAVAGVQPSISAPRETGHASAFYDFPRIRNTEVRLG